jgi:NAD(P)H-flavin reductase
MVKTYLPPADGANNMIMVCGPPPMYKAVCGGKKVRLLPRSSPGDPSAPT